MTATIRSARRTSRPALALFLAVYLAAFAIILAPQGSGAIAVQDWQADMPLSATTAKGNN